MSTSIFRNALVNGRYLTRAPTGVDRFAIEVVATLSRRQGHAPRVAVPCAARLHRAEEAPAHLERTGYREGQAWEQLELGAAAGTRTLLNLCNTAPLWRREQLVVIHDAGAVANAGNYGWAFRSWYRLMHHNVMRRARVVATVSRFSRDELLRHYGPRPAGIEVIPEGGEHILRTAADPAILDRLALHGRRFVLAVGSRSPNKNFAGVLKALALLDDPDLLLVAVGGGDPRIYAASASLSDPRLRSAGFVTDGQLRALYEQAACFAFPSHYEGFGLPPLEAMCCGCPVIVSDRASLPEVCGDAALYCDPDDPATLAAALRRVLSSAALRQELRAAGLVRARGFGWDGAAHQLEQILDARFH